MNVSITELLEYSDFINPIKEAIENDLDSDNLSSLKNRYTLILKTISKKSNNAKLTEVQCIAEQAFMMYRKQVWDNVCQKPLYLELINGLKKKLSFGNENPSQELESSIRDSVFIYIRSLHAISSEVVLSELLNCSSDEINLHKFPDYSIQKNGLTEGVDHSDQ